MSCVLAKIGNIERRFIAWRCAKGLEQLKPLQLHVPASENAARQALPPCCGHGRRHRLRRDAIEREMEWRFGRGRGWAGPSMSATMTPSFPPSALPCRRPTPFIAARAAATRTEKLPLVAGISPGAAMWRGQHIACCLVVSDLAGGNGVQGVGLIGKSGRPTARARASIW